MSTVQVKRNQSMECAKLIASLFVVFIHVEFPGEFGAAVVSLARFAVPVFFAISGYFSYQVGYKKMPKRILHIGKIYIAAVFASFLCGSIVTLYQGNNLFGYMWGFIPGTENLAKLFLLSESFFPGTMHAWYLLSIGECYFIMYFYTRFFNDKEIRYQPLYCSSICLLLLHLLMGEMAPAAGIYLPNTLYRNALFFGLPTFSLGIFAHEYQEALLSAFAVSTQKLVCTFFFGVLLILIQWKGVGVGELPPGAVICAISLLLYLVTNPCVSTKTTLGKWIISNLGLLSTVVYVVHPPLIGIYETFFQQSLTSVFSSFEPWLRPVLIAFLSALLGIGWVFFHNLLHSYRPDSRMRKGQ